MNWLKRFLSNDQETEKLTDEQLDAAKDLLAWNERTEAAKAAGAVDGRHYSDYTEAVRELERQGREDDAVRLLLRLVEAAESQNAVDDAGIPGWSYGRLAIIYRKQKDYAAEVAILKRFSLQKPAPGPAQEKLLDRLPKAQALLDKNSQ